MQKDQQNGKEERREHEREKQEGQRRMHMREGERIS